MVASAVTPHSGTEFKIFFRYLLNFTTKIDKTFTDKQPEILGFFYSEFALVVLDFDLVFSKMLSNFRSLCLPLTNIILT